MTTPLATIADALIEFILSLLRDPAADMSLSVMCPRDLVQNAPVKLTEGVQVIMHGKLQFHPGRGTLALRVNEFRAVGLGELLERSAVALHRPRDGVVDEDIQPVEALGEEGTAGTPDEGWRGDHQPR